MARKFRFVWANFVVEHRMSNIVCEGNFMKFQDSRIKVTNIFMTAFHSIGNKIVKWKFYISYYLNELPVRAAFGREIIVHSLIVHRFIVHNFFSAQIYCAQ